MTEKLQGRARGGAALAAKMTPEQRKAKAMKMVEARKEKAALPEATHTGVIKIGDLGIPCYVLKNGERVLSGRGMQEALRLVDEAAPPSGQKAGSRMDRFLGTKSLKPLIYKRHTPDHFLPVKFVYQGSLLNGYRAEVLVDICEAMLEARDLDMLNTARKQIIAKQCDILMRGFARVGIIALIDEATGYQKDRARDALAKILEAYVAKELQPYIKTFDAVFYEQMFRLRGLPYPPEKISYRPSYFGHLTNDIVYGRLAPGVLKALKDEAKKEEKKTHLHRHLTPGYGKLELIKHLSLVVAYMRDSANWASFIAKLNKYAPRFNETIPLDIDEVDR
ncbi:MAG: P63C domain-containing protein [Gallionellaceae bacterium]